MVLLPGERASAVGDEPSWVEMSDQHRSRATAAHKQKIADTVACNNFRRVQIISNACDDAFAVTIYSYWTACVQRLKRPSFAEAEKKTSTAIQLRRRYVCARALQPLCQNGSRHREQRPKLSQRRKATKIQSGT